MFFNVDIVVIEHHREVTLGVVGRLMKVLHNTIKHVILAVVKKIEQVVHGLVFGLHKSVQLAETIVLTVAEFQIGTVHFHQLVY